jgi:hypothetical protein
LPKAEVRRTTKRKSLLFCTHEGTNVRKVDSWKSQLTDGTEGWIENSAIKEVK